MTAARLLILALLASPLSAQDSNFKMTKDALPEAPMAMISPSAQPRPEKVFDKKFFAVTGALAGAESLRFTTRKLVLEHEYAEGAPWVTSVPSNTHIIPKDMALYGSEFLLAYELKKSHRWLPGDRFLRKIWWAYPAVMTTIHVKNAIGNIRTQGPGGCTSIECAQQMP